MPLHMWLELTRLVAYAICFMLLTRVAHHTASFQTRGLTAVVMRCCSRGCVSQDEALEEQLKSPVKQGGEKEAILGVRLGAGSRSYMIQATSPCLL